MAHRHRIPSMYSETLRFLKLRLRGALLEVSGALKCRPDPRDAWEIAEASAAAATAQYDGSDRNIEQLRLLASAGRRCASRCEVSETTSFASAITSIASAPERTKPPAPLTERRRPRDHNHEEEP